MFCPKTKQPNNLICSSIHLQFGHHLWMLMNRKSFKETPTVPDYFYQTLKMNNFYEWQHESGITQHTLLSGPASLKPISMTFITIICTKGSMDSRYSPLAKRVEDCVVKTRALSCAIIWGHKNYWKQMSAKYFKMFPGGLERE